MNRALYHSLVSWKGQPSRKPLLVQGARQVGKTYLITEFGRREYEDLVYLNFEQYPKLAGLFESSLDPAVLLESLGAFHGKSIKPRTTLVFFDEIQACARALTSLKYFAEQAPQYHIVAAGSLLGVSVGKSTSFPVGKVSFLTLHPLSFFEFLDACGESTLAALLSKKTDSTALPEVLHAKCLELFRRFIYVGGMPEAVNSYRESKDLQKVRSIQREIAMAYEQDFSKYSSASEAIRISEVWHSAPAQLARENKKFKYSEAKKGGRASQFESAIEWLRKAGLLYPAYHLSEARLPLCGYAQHDRFKAYLLDTGILGAMLNLTSRTIIDGHALFTEFKGALTENYVATELIKGGRDPLFYWTSEGIAEVDFVLEHEGSIIPLEVKSGSIRGAKGLHVFSKAFAAQRIYRTSPRNFTLDNTCVNIPLYGMGRFAAAPFQL